MEEKISKFFRIITIAPFMCLLATLSIYFIKPQYFSGKSSLISAICFLTIFPILSYPVCFVVRPLRIRGRKMQRTMAIIFAFLGYALAFGLSFAFKDSLQIKIYYFTYLLSSFIILIFRIFNKFNPSGHASGIAGPITFLVIYVNYYFAFLYVLVFLIWYISIKMERHTNSEYLAGSLIPVTILILSLIL